MPIHLSHRGRGTVESPPNRFERLSVESDDGAWEEIAKVDPDFEPRRLRTEFLRDDTKSLITANDSPDIGFTHSLNPYRGCEHGCAYCYARPYHEFLGFSSGLDFETKIMVKLRAPELLRHELSSPRWEPQSITFSGVTDCYQPAERQFRLTRACLEVCAELRNPIAIITKNALVTRDRDVLGELARHGGVAVFVSVTSLDSDLAGKLEPRAARPSHRLRAIRELAAAGIPVGVMVAPIVPGLTDHEMPAILAAAADAGATHAGYTILRLPYAVKEIFVRWLDDHAPSKKARILSRVREVRGGSLKASDWGRRLHGEGIFAEQIRALFTVAARRAGLAQDRLNLSTAHFRRPGGAQLTLAL
jgi:DNA repair photolyase